MITSRYSCLLLISLILATAPVSSADDPEKTEEEKITTIADLGADDDERMVTMIFKVTGTPVVKNTNEGEFPEVIFQIESMKDRPDFSVSAKAELAEILHRFALVSPNETLVGRSIKASGKIRVFDTFAPPSDEGPYYHLELSGWKKFTVLPKLPKGQQQ